MKNLTLMIGMILLFTSCQKEKISHAAYEGKDISNEASIIRDKDTKAVLLEIKTAGKWELYSGNSIDSINFSQPLIKGEGSGTFPLNITNDKRSYFQLVTDEGKAILADKHLPMTGGYNFRDLGGIKTINGKYIKWGKIFRSDDMHHLTDSDLNYLASIPLISIVDFRTEKEIQEAPDKTPASLKNHFLYNITPGKLTDMDMNTATREDLIEGMKEVNRMLVSDTACVAQYKKFFDLLQNETYVPLMFHCSAGKDRTGMGAALILFALGVDEETVKQDYLLSNTYLADKYAALMEEYPNLEPLFTVRQEYLEAGIKQMKEDHGSVENYLTNVLRVDIPRFREMYLY